MKIILSFTVLKFIPLYGKVGIWACQYTDDALNTCLFLWLWAKLGIAYVSMK